MTTNFIRALIFTLSIMTASLFWLAAFMLKVSTQTYGLQSLPPGELLVPAILFVSAIPLSWIAIKNLVPRLFLPENHKAVLLCRLFFSAGFIGIFLLGFMR